MNQAQLEDTLKPLMRALGYEMVYMGLDDDGWHIYILLDMVPLTPSDLVIFFEPDANTDNIFALIFYTEIVTGEETAALMISAATAGVLGVEKDFDVQQLAKTLQGKPMMYQGIPRLYMISQALVAELRMDEECLVFLINPAYFGIDD